MGDRALSFVTHRPCGFCGQVHPADGGCLGSIVQILEATEGGDDMATVVTLEATESTIEIAQSMYDEIDNLKRQLAGERERVRDLLFDSAELTRRLERSIRKSKGRRRAVKQMEVALLRERAKK